MKTDNRFKASAKKLKHRVRKNYIKSYLKKPSSISKVEKMESLLKMTYDSFLSGDMAYATKDCVEFYKEFLDLERIEHAPQGVTPSEWKDLCRARRSRILAELKVRIAALDYAEVEDTLNYYSCLYVLRVYKIQMIRNEIRTELQKWMNYFSDIPTQVVIKNTQNLVEYLKIEKGAKTVFIPRQTVLKRKADIQAKREQLREVKLSHIELRNEFTSILHIKKIVETAEEDFEENESWLEVFMENRVYVKTLKQRLKQEVIPWGLPTFSSPPAGAFEMLRRNMMKTQASVDRFNHLIVSVRKINEMLYQESNEASFHAGKATKLLEGHSQYVDPEVLKYICDKNLNILFQYSTLTRIFNNNLVELKKLRLEVEMARMKKYPILRYESSPSKKF